jgi:hypothetical protein
MAIVTHISNRRMDAKGEAELFDLHLSIGLTIIGMRHCQNSGKHWVDFPSTQYGSAGSLKHFAFLRSTPGLRNELNRECLETLGVIEKEPRLV